MATLISLPLVNSLFEVIGSACTCWYVLNILLRDIPLIKLRQLMINMKVTDVPGCVYPHRRRAAAAAVAAQRRPVIDKMRNLDCNCRSENVVNLQIAQFLDACCAILKY